jgi:hypothetical protein
VSNHPIAAFGRAVDASRWVGAARKPDASHGEVLAASYFEAGRDQLSRLFFHS